MVKMSSGLLSLKWNHHRSTFLHVLANIRQKESYSDVTLACAGKFYPTHKLVLSTCSEYFEEMFDRTQCKHPVIVLKDIGADDLEALLSYMYDGEVNVLQENLSSLIKAAECLKIKGLAVADNDPNERTKEKKLHSSSSNSGSNSSSNSRDVQRNDRRPVSSNGSGIKRSNVNSSSGEDGSQPTKRRRPEARSQHSTPAPSEDKEAASHTDSATTESGATESAADASSSDKAEDEVPADGQGAPEQSEDSQAFIQGLNAETGVKAEPVEVLDELSFDDRDDGEDAGSGQPAGDLTDFTEEKFSGGEGDDPALWSGGDAPDLFSQPSTSNFGEDDSNNDQGGGGKSGNTSSSMLPHGVRYSPAFKSASFSTEAKSALGLGQRDEHSSVKWQGAHDLSQLSTRQERAEFSESNPPIISSSTQDGDYFSNINVVSNASDADIPAIDNAFFHRILGPELLSSSRPPGGQTSPSLQQQTVQDSNSLYIRGLDSDSRLAVYSCRVCTYRSKKLCNMKAHVRTHNQEKPFSCPKCDYRATQMSNLKTHVMRHHFTDFHTIFHEPTKAFFSC